MAEHEGTHIIFQQDNGELAEDLIEGSLEDAELPGTPHEHSILAAHAVEDARVPPEPEQAPAVSGVVPPVPDPTPIEPEPVPLDPDVPGRPPDPIDADQAEETVDGESADSFPSSDPPSHWAGLDPE